VDTHNAQAAAGTKLLSVRNATVEKASFDKDGVLTARAVYGEIFDGSATAATSLASPAQLPIDSNGPCQSMTCDGAHGLIDATVAGTYAATFSGAYVSNDAAAEVSLILYKEGAAVAANRCRVNVGPIASGVRAPVGFSCLVSGVAAADTFEVYATNSEGADTVVENPTLALHRLN
jgi:hypothetical protein